MPARRQKQVAERTRRHSTRSPSQPVSTHAAQPVARPLVQRWPSNGAPCGRSVPSQCAKRRNRARFAGRTRHGGNSATTVHVVGACEFSTNFPISRSVRPKAPRSHQRRYLGTTPVGNRFTLAATRGCLEIILRYHRAVRPPPMEGDDGNGDSRHSPGRSQGSADAHTEP